MKACILSLLCASAAAEKSFVPTWMWSGVSTFKGRNSQLLDQLSTDTISSFINNYVSDASSDLDVQAALKKQTQASGSPEVVVVFVYDQLRTDQVARLSQAGALDKLQSSLAASSSSLSLPYSQSSDGQFINKLSPAARGKTIASGVTFPNAEVVALEDLVSVLEARQEIFTNGVPDLVVVKLGKLTPAQDAIMGGVCDLITARSHGKYIALLTANDITPLVEEGIQMNFDMPQPAGHGRRLTEGDAPKPKKDAGACGGDGTCEYPIPITPNVLTGLIVGFMLLIIFLIGFNCLFALQTPRKFDAAA